MNPEDFLAEVLAPVREFCRTLDSKPPAYSYIPLRSDEERIRVMQSRLFNEMRAADLFGTWLKTTPELDCQSDHGGVGPRGNGPCAVIVQTHSRSRRRAVRL